MCHHHNHHQDDDDDTLAVVSYFYQYLKNKKICQLPSCRRHLDTGDDGIGIGGGDFLSTLLKCLYLKIQSSTD